MANKLTIGLALDDGLDKPDGVQQYILTLGNWLTAQGHQVHYLVGQTKRTDITNVHSMSRNVGWKFNGNRGTMPLPASRARVRQTLDELQLDILHVQVPYSPFMGHKLIQNVGLQTAVIGTFHVAPDGVVMTAGTTGLGMLLRQSLKRFDTMLSVSSAAQVFANKTFHVDSVILPNVIDYHRFHDARPFSEYVDAVPTILFLGRLVERKGCRTLLEAVAQLRDQAGPFRVVICGRGNLETSLKHYVIEKNLQDIVTFTGFVSEAEKPRYYASADISVFPSRGGESFGIVLLEAMASGRAVVLAGDNPGYRSVLDAQPDLLFEPNNSLALAQKLQQLLENPAQCQKHQAWGEQYTARFDVAVVGQQLMDTYNKALQKRLNP